MDVVSVDSRSSPDRKIALFRSLFRGREDVYPRRFESVSSGRSGYAPACANEALLDGPRGALRRGLARGGGIRPEKPVSGEYPRDTKRGCIVTVASHGFSRQRDTANGVVVVRLPPTLCPTDEQFYEFCRLNNELRIERGVAGDVSILLPAGWETAAKNAEITHQLQDWARMNGTGRAADSSAGYVLPNGAIRSPDASWVSNERLASLSTDGKLRFLPMCPDFVIELRSATDPLRPLWAKMSEYIACGALLGWLIDPASRKVVVYRPQLAAEELDSPTSVLGDPELPGFRLLLGELWQEPG